MRKSFLLLCLLALGLQTVSAATTTRSSYIVEVLVIQHIGADEAGEIWINRENKKKDGSKPDLSKAVIVSGTPPSDSRLTQIADMIREDKNYRILAHKRWFQYAEPRSNSKLIRINGAENTEPVLDGSLLFYSTRYLHIMADLYLKEKQTTTEDAEEQPGSVYRIKEKRRIRIRQINYFDHPKFGLLVYVEPKK